MGAYNQILFPIPQCKWCGHARLTAWPHHLEELASSSKVLSPTQKKELQKSQKPAPETITSQYPIIHLSITSVSKLYKYI